MMSFFKFQKTIERPDLRRWLILMLVFIILCCLIYYVSLLVNTISENQRKARVFEQSLNASINQFEYLPDLLGQDTLLINQLRYPQTDHSELSNKLKYVADRSGADDIFILDAEGTVVASSNYDLGSRSFYGKNYSFRPYFKQAKNLLLRQFYFAKGATTGVPGFFISAPVLQENNDVLGVVVVKLELRRWQDAWRESKDQVIVADNNGVIILSSEPEWLYKTIGEMPEEIIDEIKQNKQFPKEEHTPIYTKVFPLRFIGSGKSAFWSVGNTNYLTSVFAMKNTGWTLYHLQDHKHLFTAFLWVLCTLLSLGGFTYLLVRERVNKLDMRRKARELEAQRRQQLQMLIDNIHIGVLVFDEEGEIQSTNEHAKHLLLEGEEYGEKKPIKVSEIIDIDISADDFDTYLLEDISTPAYHETVTLRQFQNQHDDQVLERPVMFSVGKVTTETGKGYLMTVIDISRRKLVENELLQLNESLEEKVEIRTKELRDTQSALMKKNKAVALGNMAATIVHELSQPLAAINSSTAAIQSKMESKNWVGLSESAKRLKPLSNKMNNVVKLLKYFSYTDKEIDEVFDLTELVNQIVDVIQDTLNEKGVKLSMSTPHIGVMVRGNHLKIDLAISNILKNAIEAAELNDAPQIYISTEVDGNNNLVLHVEDNGEGVGEHIMGQLFNPYFTTKEVGKGMGLGLAITYEIVQQYGGKIEAINTDKGAKFSLSLPIMRPSEINKSTLINKKSKPLINLTGT